MLIEITTLAVVATAAALVHIHRLRDDDLRFAGGYLLTWAAAGLLAFVLGDAVGRLPGDVLAWDHAGRALAGGTLVVAAAYELTPLKDFCLGKCRSPLGFLLGSWRDGWSGALRMGAKNGAWCVGCCWALMASLFALGIMSVPSIESLELVLGDAEAVPLYERAEEVDAVGGGELGAELLSEFRVVAGVGEEGGAGERYAGAGLEEAPDAGVFLAGDGEELAGAGDEAIGAAEEFQDGVGLVDALVDGQVLEGALEGGGEVVGEVAGSFGVVDLDRFMAQAADTFHQAVSDQWFVHAGRQVFHAGSLPQGERPRPRLPDGATKRLPRLPLAHRLLLRIADRRPQRRIWTAGWWKLLSTGAQRFPAAQR